MTLSVQDVEKIANLASIKLSETEITQLHPELSNIITMIDTIDKIDTDHITPMAHPLDTKQRLRADTVTETDQHALFQTLAPEVTQDLYLVPKVIEEAE